MGQIEKYKKPELVILSEKTKIRDYQVEEGHRQGVITVNRLIFKLGVGDKADERHHLAGLEFILKALGHYTFEEIEKAFDLFVSGEFTTKPLQQFNALVVGTVMREFEDYKKEHLIEWRRKEREAKEKVDKMTESEKQRVMLDAYDAAVNELEYAEDFEYSKWHLYDWLIKEGRMEEPTEEYRKAAYKVAKRELIEEQKIKIQNSNNIYEKRNLKKIMLGISDETEKGKIVNRAKSEIIKQHILSKKK